MVRCAAKWYSWAGLALTLSGAYFAGNGDIRFGRPSEIYAAVPPAVESGVTWKASPGTTEPSTVALAPATTVTTDPFRASTVPTETPLELRPVDGIKVPVTPVVPDPVVTTPPKTLNGSRAGAVLEAYKKSENEVRTAGIVEEGPRLDPPAPLPAAVKTDTTSKADINVKPVAAPVRTDGALPLPVPAPLPPIPAPVAPKMVAPPMGNGAQLPPLGKFVAPVQQPVPLPAPMGAGGEAPRPLENLIAQETIPIAPVPVPVPKTDIKKDQPTAPKRRSFTLPQDDEIKLNAAQNAARLKDFARAAQLMGEIIAKHPNNLDLRFEFAGILLAAGETKRAIAELELVIRAQPNVAGHRLMLGDAYMAVRNYKGAAAVFMSALEMVQGDPRLSDRTPEVVIRAARAYALDGDLFRAAQLTDRYLSGIRPDDEKAPLAMGSMLLDLDRPYDALPYLIEKRKQLLRMTDVKEQEEHDLRILEVLASMVRGFARVGERHQAMEAVQEMAPKVPTQTGLRIALGDILFEMGEYELGGHVYNQVLSIDPANGAALIGIARVYLESFQPNAAKRILDSFIPNAANQRGYLMTYSSYHQTVGEYTEAKQIYRDMLRRNEADHEVRYALGRVYEYTKEWEKAKAEFAKIPPQDKMARKARLWFGMALLHQRKFGEAASVAEQMLRDDPNNADALSMQVRALAKLGQFERSVHAGRGYLATNPKDDRNATTVRLAVARALLEGNRNLDAAREYEIALSKPAGRIPEAYYGLARAAEKLGNGERANQIIGTLTGALGGDLRGRLLLADHYSEDFEDQRVIDICGGITGVDGDNLAVLIRLADAQQRSSRWPGNPADCFGTCQRILRQSPTNVRGHLAMSRSFAVAQNYRKSSIQYDQLIAIDPEFTIPPRERARVLYSDHQFSAARSQYNAAVTPTPVETVTSQMAYYAQREGRMRQAFGPYLNGGMNGPALRAELARVASTAGDDEVRMAAHRMLCDYDATVAWQEPFRMERDAKELKDYRNYMAVPQYDAINAFEPTNTETAFDEGQVHGALKMTRQALTWYSNCLAIDPTHRESIAASERASADISPKFNSSYDWSSMRGRSGLVSIDHQRFMSSVSLPLGDENEYVQLGFMRLGHFPTDDRALWGNAPFIRAQKKYDDNRLLLYGQAGVEQYPTKISTRPVFDIGYTYDHNDVVRTRSGLFLENVIDNGETIRTNIYRYGAYTGVDFKPTRTWAFGGTGTYTHYSDDNNAFQGYLYNEVALSLPPKMLKLVKRFNISGFEEQTEFFGGNPNPPNLFGVVHPYFSPELFASWEFRVEWWHWLSRDFFVHSNQCWYSLQYGIVLDNNIETYHDFRMIGNYDVNSWLTFGCEGRAMISSNQAFDMYSAMVFMQIRFLAR